MHAWLSLSEKQCSKQGGVNPQLRLVCTTSTYVLSFETEADRDAIVAVLNKCQKTLEEDADMPSLIDRQRQLAVNPNLQVEHAAIVGGGILSEGEFWRSRSHHHRIQSVSDNFIGQGQTAGTKIGLSNALVEAVERMDEGMARVGISKIIYDFTAQDREQIMVEKPSVRKAYLAHVPHSMSEQQFWERFVKHEYSKKASRKRELGEGVANIPDDEQLFSSRPELLPSMEKRMKKVSSHLTLSASRIADTFDTGSGSILKYFCGCQQSTTVVGPYFNPNRHVGSQDWA